MTAQRKEQLIAFCQQLLQIKSYSGEEQGVADALTAFANAHNFTHVHIDRYGNCICHIKGNKEGPAILFDGHMDTVPVPDATLWTHPPFAAEIEDGKLYGRGASDMKGALSAMMMAAACYVQDCKGAFAGDIYVAGVVHEECFEGVAAREISAYVRPDYVIIGEASGLNLKIGQRGRGELVVETFGVPAHSANPEKGVNAVYKMTQLIQTIQLLPLPHHRVLGDGILELTDIKSTPYPGASVVPSYCRATYDRRLLVGETPESVLAPLQALLKTRMASDPTLQAKVSFATGTEQCYTGEPITGQRFFPAWLYDKDDPFVQTVYQGLTHAGFTPSITQYNFCTNGSHYAGEANIPTIGLGPSEESLAHTIDEYITLSQLEGACQCYYAVLKTLLQ
ncbi:YgeY family selenium metabolism-linked hydrolase [Bengtsoniella intestinalis]|uniref:YgeY family selenium metabolism-linked hydrolase n=1 Tax=Bengtsoniella intestinalis TaxID=3073143 RepID=UPI00391F6B9D